MVWIEFTRPGKGTSRYKEHLILDEPEYKVLFLESYQPGTASKGESVFQSDAPIIWFVFPGEWYEVGRFHTPAGEFTGWYTNICTPFEIDDSEWRTTDLFLDFWQPVNGEPCFLDEDELEDAILTGLVDDNARRMIERTRIEIQRAAQRGGWPPAVAREIDLPHVRALREGAG